MGCDGVAEPDDDGGDGDGASVDVVAFVVAGGDGAVCAELVDCSFDGVAVAVMHLVEGGGSSAAGALAVAGGVWSSLIAMTALMPRLDRWTRIAWEE